MAQVVRREMAARTENLDYQLLEDSLTEVGSAKEATLLGGEHQRSLWDREHGRLGFCEDANERHRKLDDSFPPRLSRAKHRIAREAPPDPRRTPFEIHVVPEQRSRFTDSSPRMSQEHHQRVVEGSIPTRYGK